MPTSIQTYSAYVPRPIPVFQQDKSIVNVPTTHELSPEELRSFDLEISSETSFVSVTKPTGSQRKQRLIGISLALLTAMLITCVVAVSVVLTKNKAAATTITTATTTTATTATTSTVTTATSTTTTSTTSTTTTTSSTTTTPTTTTSTTTTTATTTTTTMIPPNLLVNPGGETGSLSPWTKNSGGNAILDNGVAGASLSPRTGSYHFFGGAAASNTLQQNVVIFNRTQGYTENQLDSGTLSAYVVFYQMSYYQSSGNDQGRIDLTFRYGNGSAISTVSTATAVCTSYCVQSRSFVLPAGTRSIDYIMVFIRVSGTNLDAYFDDNSLKVY